MSVYKKIKEYVRENIILLMLVSLFLIIVYITVSGRLECGRSYKYYELGLTNGKTVKGYFEQNFTGFENDSVVYPHMSVNFVKEIKEKE